MPPPCCHWPRWLLAAAPDQDELATAGIACADCHGHHTTRPDERVRYKTAWLAFRGVTQQQVATALRRSARSQSWQPAIAASYAEDDALVAVTPPVSGHGGKWVLATGVALMLKEPDVAALSERTGTEVQYILSDRISETHGWARADGGHLLRAFDWKPAVGVRARSI